MAGSPHHNVAGEDEVRALAEAVAVFNRGEWKAAADAFEVPYHEGKPAKQALYLGLIRAAAALHHRDAGHPAAARRLHASAREVLAPLAGTGGDRSLDLARLLEELDGAFAERPGGGAPGPWPRLRFHGSGDA